MVFKFSLWQSVLDFLYKNCNHTNDFIFKINHRLQFHLLLLQVNWNKRLYPWCWEKMKLRIKTSKCLTYDLKTADDFHSCLRRLTQYYNSYNSLCSNPWVSNNYAINTKTLQVFKLVQMFGFRKYSYPYQWFLKFYVPYLEILKGLYVIRKKDLYSSDFFYGTAQSWQFNIIGNWLREKILRAY